MTDDPFHDELREQLDFAYRDARVRPGSLAATTRAGRRRQHRRRKAGAATAVAAVGLGAATVGWLSRPASPRVETFDRPAPETTGAPPAPDGPVAADFKLTTAEPALTWRRVDPDSAAAVGSSSEALDGGQPPRLPGLMVSTAPGLSREYRMWRSQDGVSWTEVAGLPSGLAISDTLIADDRVYALSTMPGSSPGTVSARLSTSNDLGATWDDATFASDNPEMTALPGVEGVDTETVGLAAAGDVILVLVKQEAVLTNEAALLAEAGLDGVDVTGWSSDGLLIGPCVSDDLPANVSIPADGISERCEYDEVSWRQLGPVGPTLRAAKLGEARLFVSVGGGELTEVKLPSGPPLVSYKLQSVGDSIVLTGALSHESDGAPSMWETSDGRQWNELASPPLPGSLQRLADGRLMSLGYNAWTGATSIAMTRDGRTWEQADFDDLGEEHVAAVGPVATSSSGVTTIAAVSRPATPQERAELYPTTPAAGDSGTATTVALNEYTFSHYEILHSVDGRAWSRESVADLAGVSNDDISSVTRVQTAGNTVVVAVSLTAAEGEIPKQIVLVGTPKG